MMTEDLEVNIYTITVDMLISYAMRYFC